MTHFIDSLRDEVRIIRRLPKRFGRRHRYQPLEMPPISWSNEKYYSEQVCCLLFRVSIVISQVTLMMYNDQMAADFLIIAQICSYLLFRS